ncbi:VWA domain-containing protein [Streptomyces vietnamensis]|uniref:Inter-alpha-trypsin inhibitor heavy chain H5 n=1 Tax=Streptomyces vietnamensis TaxID=362257 RepID=A0A0B5I1M4_9ACTN|nr:VWA domain-containing protein [Streptomyces vietnamensis]AJF63538.1 Inter-alpha-trypsin inhibitor heavy chain H5 [Streptomyces vietnamensis]
MITRKRLATGACALLAALSVALLPTGAAADEPAAKESPKVELVLDVSGSMRAKDIDGKSRMSAAKQAFNEVLDAVPEEVRLGIRTLGADYPGNDRKRGCKDTRALYPVGPLDRTEAKTAVATLAPTGWTPIGPALLGAADDLGKDGATKRIVLITDGEDTCGVDPCQIARQIAAEGIHLVIDTLGLVPDAKTRQQLACIAEATGGTYTSVHHTEDLAGRVKQLVDRAADPVVTPVATQGAARCEKAPQLKPGLYTDRESFGEHRWYRVDLLPGQELRASVSVSADRAVNNDYGVLLRAVTLHGREIVRGSEAGDGRTDVISTGLRYPKPEADDEPGDAKPAAETVCLQVSNSFSAPPSVKTTPGMPVELTVDVVDGPASASDIASFGLGRGWWLLGVLVLVGFLAGLLWGWLSRWRVAVWRTN